MENTTYIDRAGLWVAVYDDLIYIDNDIDDFSAPVTLTPDGAREVRDAITHWLDHLEKEADLRALNEARANDDGTSTPLRDFMEEDNDDE